MSCAPRGQTPKRLGEGESSPVGTPPSIAHQRLFVITHNPRASDAAFYSLLEPRFGLCPPVDRGLVEADVRGTWGRCCVCAGGAHSDDHDRHSGKTLNWGSWAITGNDTNYPGKGHNDSGVEYAHAPDLDHEVRVYMYIRSRPRPLQRSCQRWSLNVQGLSTATSTPEQKKPNQTPIGELRSVLHQSSTHTIP